MPTVGTDIDGTSQPRSVLTLTAPASHGRYWQWRHQPATVGTDSDDTSQPRSVLTVTAPASHGRYWLTAPASHGRYWQRHHNEGGNKWCLCTSYHYSWPMLAINTVQTWNEMQCTISSTVGRSPVFALDHIQLKLFRFFGNAMKRQRTVHPSTSTPHNNTRHHRNCIFVLF